MIVSLKTRDREFKIRLATFDTMTTVEQFQRFLNVFRDMKYYLISPTHAISFESVEEFKLLEGEEDVTEQHAELVAS